MHLHPQALLIVSWLMLTAVPLAVAPAALAEQAAAPGGRLVKVVILSRHGVRSPIPSQAELATWTASPWPTWQCDAKVCEPGQFTPRGRMLAEQMGTYYRSYLSQLLPADRCPGTADVFFWADVSERTRETALALLRGFRPACESNPVFPHGSAGAP